jgi:hypothetical protein
MIVSTHLITCITWKLWRTEIQPYGLTRLANMSVRSVMPSHDRLIGRAIRAKGKAWKFDLCSLWLSCGAAWHAEPKCHAPIHGYLGCVTSKHPREQVQEKDSCAAAFLSMGLLSFSIFLVLCFKQRVWVGGPAQTFLPFLVSPLFLLERQYMSKEIFHATTDGRTCNGEGRSRK